MCSAKNGTKDAVPVTVPSGERETCYLPQCDTGVAGVGGGGGEGGPLYAVTTPEMTYERSLAMNHLGLKSTSATWIPRTPLLPISLQRQY